MYPTYISESKPKSMPPAPSPQPVIEHPSERAAGGPARPPICETGGYAQRAALSLATTEARFKKIHRKCATQMSPERATIRQPRLLALG